MKFFRHLLFSAIVSCSSCGTEEKEVVTNKEAESLPEPIAYLHRDSCLKYSSDELYTLAVKYERQGLIHQGYFGDSGKIFFERVYDNILYEFLQNDYPGYDSIYAEFYRHCMKINDLFSCAAGGGTLYSRMEGEITGFVRQRMLEGLKSDYKSDVYFDEKIWRERITRILELSYTDTPQKIMDKCYRPFKFTEKRYRGWLMMQVYEYAGFYNFGP